MSDFSEQIANFSSGIAQESQPITDLVNQRMQRIQELERRSQERNSNLAGTNNNSDGRLTRRDRIIQNTQRPPERRNYLSSIQRTPIRSQSFEIDAQPRNDVPFRDIYDSSRMSLFGARLTGSSENMQSLGRRGSDTNLAQRVLGQAGSDSGSDSSIASLSNRTDNNIIGGVYSAGMSSPLVGSDSSLNGETRSSSVTRDRRDSSLSSRRTRPAVNLAPDSSLASRLLASRQPRSRDSRRRRTIQGTDRNVVEALEREKLTFEPFSRISPNFSASSDTELSKSSSIEPIKPIIPTLNGNARPHKSEKPSHYKPYLRQIVLNADDTMPIISKEKEKLIFVHSNGKTYWLNYRHPLMRYFKTASYLPELLISPARESEEELGLIESIDGEPDFRYDRFREICNISIKRSGDKDEEEPLPTGDEERYKTKTLYTSPRERPSIEDYFTTRQVPSLYDGIDLTVFDIECDPTSNTNDLSNGDVVNIQSNMLNDTQESNNAVHNNTMTGNSTFQVNNVQAPMEIEAHNNDMEIQDNLAVNDVNTAITYGRDNDTEMMVETEESHHENTNEDFHQNQQMSIRQTLVEHHLETEAETYENSASNLSLGRNDQLMDHLQMIHESTGVPLDTSHLDEDELRMIQMALAENPSPSPPSSPVQGQSEPSYPVKFEPSYAVAARETVVALPELGTILESPGKLQLPSLDFSPLAEQNGSTGTFLFPEENHKNNENREEIQENKEDPEEVTQEAEQVSTQEQDDEEEEETFNYTEEFEQEVTIPFPHSPNSPFKYYNSASQSPNSASGYNSHARRKLSTDTEPPAIGIADNERTLRNVGSRSQSVKSDGSHNELTPGGSETINTVFEEFRSTIPQGMINNTWSPK